MSSIGIELYYLVNFPDGGLPEESKGERGSQGVQDQHAIVRRTCCIFMYVRMYACIYVFICICIHMFMHMCMYSYVGAYVHTLFTFLYVCIYIYIDRYTYVCVCAIGK